MKTVAKIIAYVAIALVVVLGIGLVYKFTNGFNEDFKTFYIEYDGKQILTEYNEMTLASEQKHQFTVKYTFDKEDAEPKGYSVKVIPNMESDFDYEADGERYLFSKISDFTSCFTITKSDTSFELEMPKEFNLQKALSIIHDGKQVTVPDDAEVKNPMPFCLVISSYNGKVTYKINFGVLSATVKDVTLDKSEIVFGGT